MIDSSTRRAIRWLRNREKNRRYLAAVMVVLGATMFALGLGALKSSGSRMAEIIGALEHEPGYLLPLVALESSVQTISVLVTLGGIFVVITAIVRFCFPDSKTVALLALIDKTRIGDSPGSERDA